MIGCVCVRVHDWREAGMIKNKVKGGNSYQGEVIDFMDLFIPLRALLLY